MRQNGKNNFSEVWAGMLLCILICLFGVWEGAGLAIVFVTI